MSRSLPRLSMKENNLENSHPYSPIDEMSPRLRILPTLLPVAQTTFLAPRGKYKQQPPITTELYTKICWRAYFLL